jgi:hypothetical protein
MSKLLEPIETSFPFEWCDLEYYPNSRASRYLLKQINATPYESLINSSMLLINTNPKSYFAYDSFWWNFQITDWENDIASSNEHGLSKFQVLLTNSEIETSYAGSCRVFDWLLFMKSIVPCIVDSSAPYSPIIFSHDMDLFFYLHHSGEIGIYLHNTKILEQLPIPSKFILRKDS